jgi:hypothetical protein
LKFNSVDHGCQLAKYSTPDIFQHFVHLLIEYASDNIRMISSCLPFLWPVWIVIFSLKLQQSLLYLRPVWVDSHGEKEIWLVKVSAYSHRILKELIHVASAAWVGGGKNNVSSMLSHICRDVVTMSKLCYRVLYGLVKICPNCLLIIPDPEEVAVLY